MAEATTRAAWKLASAVRRASTVTGVCALVIVVCEVLRHSPLPGHLWAAVYLGGETIQAAATGVIALQLRRVMRTAAPTAGPALNSGTILRTSVLMIAVGAIPCIDLAIHAMLMTLNPSKVILFGRSILASLASMAELFVILLCTGAGRRTTAFLMRTLDPDVGSIWSYVVTILAAHRFVALAFDFSFVLAVLSGGDGHDFWFEWEPRIRWAGLALVGVVIVVCIRFWFAAGGAAKRGHCRRCGYDLTGIASDVCPECGSPIMILRAPSEEPAPSPTPR